jgi:flagellar motor switch protein FliM
LIDDNLGSSPILAVFKAEEWENFGLFTIDSSLIYSIIDVLLGGRRGQTAIRVEADPTRRSKPAWSSG